MSPARRWPPPHRPQGCSFCPWFFSWTSGFSCYKLSQVGHTCRIIWRGRNWATARGVPVVGQRLWLLFPGLCTFPLPGDPSGITAGAPLVLSCLPCVPSLPMATLSGGSAPLCPGSVGRGMVHLGVISATPYPSAVPSWPGGRDGVGMGPQSSARPSSRSAPWISLLEKWVLPLLGLGRAPAPCRAVLQRPCPCCSRLLIPFLCKDLVRACPRLSDPRAVTLAPGGPRAAPPAPSRAGSPRDRSHVPGAPAPAQVD